MIERRRLHKFAVATAVAAAGLWLAPAARAHVLLEASLAPDQEVPPVTNSAGRATATFDLDDDTGMLTYKITITQALTGAVLAAHIHEAPRGQANPTPKVPLETDLEGIADLTPLTDPDLFLEKLFDGDIYVNLHTAANPGGEIRGQIVLSKVAGTTCSCKDAKNFGKFRSCVAKAIKKLSKFEQQRARILILKALVKQGTCGKKRGPKKAIACCFPQTPQNNIVIEHMCAAVSETACGRLVSKFGGMSLGTGTSCFKDKKAENPCSPPTSPSGAFLVEDAGF